MNPLGPAEDLVSVEIDKLVPPNIMRLTQHLHNMIYIRFFYEQIGQQPPEWIKGELVRAESALINQVDRENAQGGVFRKEEACDKEEQTKVVEKVGKLSRSLRAPIRRV